MVIEPIPDYGNIDNQRSSNTFQFKEEIKINHVPFSFGPHDYAHYFHIKKSSWELSASISNEHLKRLIKESANEVN